MLAVVIIAYNVPEFIIKHIELFKSLYKKPYELIIVDNSSDESMATDIKYHCDLNGVEYIRTRASSSNGSDSHAFAANLSYTILKDRPYTDFMYLDHDCFLIKETDLFPSDIEGTAAPIVTGLKQVKGNKSYFWPGCFVFENKPLIKELLDFSPSQEFGLDTGGMTYKLIESKEVHKDFFDEEYEQNDAVSDPNGNYYSIIGGMFMHFIKGSNWNGAENHHQRINSLFNILKNKTSI